MDSWDSARKTDLCRSWGNLLLHLGDGTILGELYASERILAESDEVKAEVPAELAQWSGPVRRESCRGWCLAG